MVINQIYSVVNAAAAQAYGSNAVAVQDLTGLIALGNTVLSSSTSTDAFLGALCDRIYKTVISNRAYTAKTRGLLMDNTVYGAALQKVYVEPFSASANAAWQINSANDPVPFNLGNHTRPSIKVKIFESRDTWKYTVSIPDYQLNSAFVDEAGLTAFVSGIFTEMNNCVSEAIENMVKLCEANFIAEKLAKCVVATTPGINAVNILHKYNAETTSTLTPASCMRDPAFLKYFGKEIKDTIDFMTERTKLFNTEGYVRNTPADEIKVHMLSKVAAAYSTYLEADTFNNELLALPGYESITSFQGIGTDKSFDEVSKIMVKTSSAGTAVTQKGIACVIFDPNAMGVLFDMQKASSQYDNERDMVKYWLKSTEGYFNDLSENAIIYYISTDADDWVIQNTPTTEADDEVEDIPDNEPPIDEDLDPIT